MSSIPVFSSVSCSHLPDDSLCNTCGWKCSCYKCSSETTRHWQECQCSCRFWVVACFAVLLGFIVVFYVSVVMRRALLLSMSSAAILASAALAAVSASTSHCGWPAFMSIALVFAFPCAYSCCWQCTNEENGWIWNLNWRRGLDTKPFNSVVIVFPGGEVQLGVMEKELEDKSESKIGSKKRRKNGMVTFEAVVDESNATPPRDSTIEMDVEMGERVPRASTS